MWDAGQKGPERRTEGQRWRQGHVTALRLEKGFCVAPGRKWPPPEKQCPEAGQPPRKSAKTHSRQRSEVYRRQRIKGSFFHWLRGRVHLQRRRGEGGRFSPGSAAQPSVLAGKMHRTAGKLQPLGGTAVGTAEASTWPQKSYSVRGGQQRPSARGLGRRSAGRGQAGRGRSTPASSPRRPFRTPAPRRDSPILRWLCCAL